MKIKYSILIGLLVLLLFSCEKPDPNGCHNSVIFYNYLTAAARNQTPYFTNPSFDTLSFASDKGDTVIFVKTKTDSTWYKEEIRGNPACDWDKNYYQVLHMLVRASARSILYLSAAYLVRKSNISLQLIRHPNLKYKNLQPRHHQFYF